MRSSRRRFIGSGFSSRGRKYSAVRWIARRTEESRVYPGKNLDLTIGAAEDYEELRPIVKSFKDTNIGVVVTIGGSATRVVKDFAPEIPTIFSFGSDAVQAGFVKSIARPESNLTGITTITGPEFQGKRLEIFKDVVPSLRRATVLYNARGENPGHELNLEMLRQSAPELGIQLSSMPVKAMNALDSALQNLSRESTDGLLVIAASMSRTRFNKIVSAATSKNFQSWEPKRFM